MKPDFTLINLIILFGAIQGLLFGILLLFQKGHPGARFLSAFLFILAYNGFETFNWSAGVNFISFDFTSYILIFGIGPSLYLYLTTLFRNKKFTRKQVALLYTPLYFQLLWKGSIILYYLLVKNNIIELHRLTPQYLHNIYVEVSEPLSVITFLVFLGLTLRQYRIFKKNKYENNAVAEEEKEVINKWAKALLICCVILGILWPLTLSAPFLFNIPYEITYYPIEILLVFFVYWIAFAGFHKVRIIYAKAEKTRMSKIPESEATVLLAKLQDAMQEDKLYLDPELNLSKLSDHTSIPGRTISIVINQHLGRSFNEFVNEYRIEEVKRFLLDPNYQHLTISGISLEAGFNSQATFQRVFKSKTGMTPREYMATSLKQIADKEFLSKNLH